MKKYEVCVQQLKRGVVTVEASNPQRAYDAAMDLVLIGAATWVDIIERPEITGVIEESLEDK